MSREFDPKTDGWHFENWGEGNWADGTGSYCNGCALPPNHAGACEFTWDLYRDTYLAINPTNDAVEAPLDTAFYEIFKKCASQGNCGGFSLLGLALYKYGGFQGFCSPASFYTGSKPPDEDAAHSKRKPDRSDLHRAINMLQARQFSSKGIMHIVDLFDANNMNDAYAAYDKVKECLAMGDFPVLSIAKSTFGDAAHTVTPYKTDDNPPGYPSGTKAMYICDSNHAYDADPAHYSGDDKLLLIKGRFEWTYAPHPGYPSETYAINGSADGWCFAVPMSLVLTKSRQPMALELLAQALITLFVSGGAVSQISDDGGHSVYKAEADLHTSLQEMETDPDKRMKGVLRWPWFSSGIERRAPGELYFIRRRTSCASLLKVTVSGTSCGVLASMGRNLFKISSSSREHARDSIATMGLVSDALSLEISTTGANRRMSVDHLLAGPSKGEWRRYRLKDIELPTEVPVTLSVDKAMGSIAVSCQEKEVRFELDIERRLNRKVVTRREGTVSTVPSKVLRIAPRSWEELEKEEVVRTVLDRQTKREG